MRDMPDMRENAAQTVKHLSGTIAGLGAWLIIAPFILPYFAAPDIVIPAPYNDVVCGVLLLILGAIRWGKPLDNVWASYTSAGIGAWLVIAPFVLAPYSFGATVNDIVIGLLAIVLGIASAGPTKSVERGI
ncbi:SPW repeat-containing protein [Hasllibacter halocynthiae]|uniref:SPW repeat-containing protein n=2 Tax=Hasllibacter halocynthiae TaxID=595589 RepID=A0A2T0X7C7_9RHOB|nr:SPW repeat-containing protein [Hasllibacter halocynthiae]